MISATEAQELHELVGASLENLRDGEGRVEIIVMWLERAREIAAVVVSDAEQT